ncbi:hypothetical protein LT336_00125 [Spiroplasma sp. JKS002671]|uniref:hypothetical protein n=1 Tax=Spiroplasma attinicola TaxID=2904537 RepID=UPI002022B25A|nr:hypothetical protein [Spiroplasma sp. JKS002671]MCL8210395.1 hypothetical protein [Spiroplasma sp. JKS002671]
MLFSNKYKQIDNIYDENLLKTQLEILSHNKNNKKELEFIIAILDQELGFASTNLWELYESLLGKKSELNYKTKLYLKTEKKLEKKVIALENRRKELEKWEKSIIKQTNQKTIEN